MLVMECVKYRSDLVSYARRMVGDYAEDVVSDLTEYFLRGRFNAPDNPLPLLIWYTRRRCIDHIRQSVSSTSLPYDLTDEVDEKKEDEKIQHIEWALSQMNPVVSRLIVLNLVERITTKELAELTGISQKRIKYIIRQGKQEIKNNHEQY